MTVSLNRLTGRWGINTAENTAGIFKLVPRREDGEEIPRGWGGVRGASCICTIAVCKDGMSAKQNKLINSYYTIVFD